MSPLDGVLIEVAKRRALDVCLAQLGDVDAMSEAEARRVLADIDGSGSEMRLLVKVLAGAVSELATDAASQTSATLVSPYEIAVEYIRLAILQAHVTIDPEYQ